MKHLRPLLKVRVIIEKHDIEMDDAPWMCACYVCQMPSSFLDIETVCCGF